MLCVYIYKSCSFCKKTHNKTFFLDVGNKNHLPKTNIITFTDFIYCRYKVIISLKYCVNIYIYIYLKNTFVF